MLNSCGQDSLDFAIFHGKDLRAFEGHNWPLDHCYPIYLLGCLYWQPGVFSWMQSFWAVFMNNAKAFREMYILEKG